MEADRKETRRLLGKLPKTITIEASVFDIVLSDEVKGGEAWGEYRAVSQHIGLQAEYPTPEKMATTVLHEILHPMSLYRCMSDKGHVVVQKDEDMVSHFSTGIAVVLMANPWLLPWLEECYTWRTRKSQTENRIFELGQESGWHIGSDTPDLEGSSLAPQTPPIGRSNPDYGKSRKGRTKRKL